ncbi:hypothetical protein BCR32DRAFT_245147 [Anaeromyces robustus]|uniref:Uncharacterized protein n=1 Tax=Anaeromyces robustus TaxID=1754192 RepID=A0A1Y1X5J5_9FUNG|nr:hypothetical protein BCR32DRAFT_245147 [Anaeromyces robustus]|eukprot:ORX81079.1 hypothetical protein BCR32DRAFT_245147 [Anaeromyces robustus]
MYSYKLKGNLVKKYIENKENDKLENLIHDYESYCNNSKNFLFSESMYDTAIKTGNAKALNILLQYETNNRLFKYNKYNKVLDSEYYNQRILGCLLNNGFEVSTDFINMMITNEEEEKNEKTLKNFKMKLLL